MNIKWSMYLYSYVNSYGRDTARREFDIYQDRNTLNILYSLYIRIVKEDGNKYYSRNYDYSKLSIDIITGSVLESNQYISKEAQPSKKYENYISADSKHYYFDNYDIFMESNWVVCCQDKDTHSTIWKKNVRHYLYTEIECKDGILYFGTGGNGGRFHVLSLANGDEIFSMVNWDYKFYWIRNNLLINNAKGVWDIINPKTGTLIESTLKGEILLRINDDFIFSQNSYNRSTKQYDVTLIYAEL